ncbi:MAG: guanine deaminase [Rubrivivax sp.]|nr:guanine deaminase [Rubrivivax sp.]MDP3615946.1 guanine deaminase [Rubrivivax sp.]
MKAIQADLLDFTAEPDWGDTQSPAVRWRPAHWLLVGDDGRIAGVQAEAPDAGVQRLDHRGRLLMPGFIDTHVHSPQIGVMASYGTELLDWLNTYTFPAETAWADPAVAAAGSAHFLDALLAHGTTSAVVFPTVHKTSAEALFAAASARGMRIIGGKVLMDRHAPAALMDNVAQAERDCIDLIQRWHGQGRNSYAVTVRFAPTSTAAQLAMAGELCRADPTLYMQTHVAENRDEVRWVSQLFPSARSYLDVYASAGLLHPRSVLAHGIWLDADDRAALHHSGAQIAFCPSSNLFLGSGLFDWRATAAAGAKVSIASDVGGGTSLSMQRTLADGYKVQAMAGQRLTAWSALHAATRGAANALHLGHEIGSLDVGRVADLCIWDWSVGAVDTRRLSMARDLHEQLFAWMTLSDERHLVGTWVAGHNKTMRSAA